MSKSLKERMSLAAAPSTKIRLATASPVTQSTRQETLAQLERLARSAAERGADFLLLPEAYFGGYPRGSDFGSKIGGRSEEGREEFLKYFRNAVDLGDIVGPAGAGGLEKWVRRELGSDEGLDSDHADEALGSGLLRGRGDGTREELERVARETGVFIVVGLVERAGGSLYCAVVYVCPRRGVIGKRRKVMPVSLLPLQGDFRFARVGDNGRSVWGRYIFENGRMMYLTLTLKSGQCGPQAPGF